MQRKIHVVQDFKHGGQAFIKDETRFVSPEDAGYFVGLGWAVLAPTDVPASPKVEPVTLQVQDGGHNQSASNPA